MAISAKNVSNVYVHLGIQTRDQRIYLKECINRTFVDKYYLNGNFLFWPDLPQLHNLKIE